MNIDFDSFFRNKVESMLITASWVEHVRHMLDLEGVSQVWGDKPEWYLWLGHAPGVYALILKDAESMVAENTTWLIGHFAVKCFPYVDSRIFSTFSSQERKAMTSDLFDQTHTPRLEVRERIPENFFTVGSISLMMDAAETSALFTVTSLDTLKVRDENASMGRLPSPASTDCRVIVRNVPGWQTSYPLFVRLMGLFAFYYRKPPVFIGATRSPGFEYLVNADKTMVCRPCSSTQQLSASLLFVKTPHAAELVDAIWRESLGSEEKIIFVRHLPSSFNNQIVVDSPPEVPVNELWWELANTEFKSELSSTCGCCDHSPDTCSASNAR